MTMSRAFDELEAMELGHVERIGRERLTGSLRSRLAVSLNFRILRISNNSFRIICDNSSNGGKV